MVQISTLREKNISSSANRSQFTLLTFLSTLLTIVFVTVFTASSADASTKKNCKNYISKQNVKACMGGKSVKTSSLRKKQHVVYTRPQPATFVINADTGKVLQAENADAARYPASLTKMMTLYLTFEALKKGKLKLDQEMPVSLHASGQPQTNIALEPGDRLSVKDAILSLVVRSANDSAVVLSEALGGTEEGFAVKMTAKARELGMKKTVFHNASGLPDPRQRTTARDLAVLGLALKRDFPQYYPFFKTEAFTFRDKTYTTHNRVMTRYEGVDGIKTGYIRASGFNLVSSAKKNGYNLVAVVLGGRTWRERDDQMIALLDQNFNRLIAKGDAPLTPRIMDVASLNPAAEAASPVTEEEAMEGQGDLTSESDTSAFKALSAPTIQPDAKAAAEVLTQQWGIQVGAYGQKSEAVKAATYALKHAPTQLAASRISITERTPSNTFYRARLVNISQKQAESACKALSEKQLNCFTFKD